MIPHPNTSIDSNNDHLNSLTSESQAFSFIEYFLRLSLHASTAKIIGAWEVSNPQLTQQFEKKAKDLLTLDSWVDESQLAAPNSEEEVVRKGFQIASHGGGIRFRVGRIALDNKDAGQEGVIRRRLMLCKVAAGRAHSATEDFAKIATIPDGYDSFVIDHDRIQLTAAPGGAAQAANADTNTPANDKGGIDLEYIVKDSTQILPTFIVVFEYDPTAEARSRQSQQCENCDAATATVFCQADTANLCASCDAQMHSTKLASRHVRTPLEAGYQTYSACRQHPEKIVEFFCPTCSRPVCVHCKMVGHHATGDAARHKLITVAEAFRGVSEAARAHDPLLEAHRKRIQQQMTAVVERSRGIDQNAHDVQQQLEELYRRALADLKSITKRKQNVLRGDMIELQRELGELDQLETFLHYQQEGGNATQFILDWTHHQRLRSELHAFPHFRQTIDVQPDIKINGAIQIHVDGATAGGAEASASTNAGSGGAANIGGMAGMYGAGGLERQASLFDGRPRYTQSPSRLRATPTVDFSTLTKTRKEVGSDAANMSHLGKL